MGLASPANDVLSLLRTMAEDSFPGSVFDNEQALESLPDYSGFCIEHDGGLALVELGTSGYPDWDWPVQVTAAIAQQIPATPELMGWVNEHNRLAVRGKYYFAVNAEGLASLVFETLIWGGHFRIVFDGAQTFETQQRVATRLRGEMNEIVRTAALLTPEVVGSLGGSAFPGRARGLLGLFAISAGDDS